MTLINAQIYTPDKTVKNGFLKFHENGEILEIGDMDALQEEAAENVMDVKGKKVLPGFIDVHIHGGNGYSSMDENYDAINKISEFHARNGTTAFLVTTSTASVDKLKSSLPVMADAVEKGVAGANLLGIHLEGPFINEKRSGAQDKSTIQVPDLSVLKEYLAAAKNTIKLVTIAPELDNEHECVKYLLDQNITVSMGHSDATFDEAVEAIKLGVNHTTHHFNGMRGIHHRDPGLAGAGLLLSEVTTELIADGFHVHPEVIKHLFATKGPDKVCLITDAVFCAGLPDGEYGRVTVTNGEVYLKDGSSLAGSSLTTIRALKNVMQYTGYSIEEVLPSLTVVPARQAGVLHEKGSLVVGKDADFLIVDEDLNIQATYVKGHPVYEVEKVR